MAPFAAAILLGAFLLFLVQPMAAKLLEGKDESIWAVLARNRESLGVLAADPRWTPIPAAPGGPADRRFLWTDDYVNLVGVIKFD